MRTLRCGCTCRAMVVAGLAVLLASRGFAAEGPAIDFTRDIRPILSNRCFACHGPDPAERQGGVEGLRLDVRNAALVDLGDGGQAIVPGDPDHSRLLERVATKDPDLRMPPADFGKPLTEREVELLRVWIQQGAPYAEHWSYVPPTRPPLPAVQQENWPRNEIDRFLLARLEAEGLKPQPEADRAALIRRVTLDLTGLPPTLEEVEAFVGDPAPDAYERLVDRLLASDAFGEHWARMWLDIARYADSAGYADDPPRTIWAYRDYVIRSFNENKPFDQFTIEQIAGDLLPDPDEEQLVATAFHRNTLTNNEGGTDDEEFRNVAIVDRVNTTLAGWMGTTMACAQCHTHKYDPLTQEEYFQLFAFFNNTADADRRDESPLIEIFTPDQKRQTAEWRQEIAAIEKTLSTLTPELTAAQEQWAERLSSPLEWQTQTPESLAANSGANLVVESDGTIRSPSESATDQYTLRWKPTGDPITALQLEALPDPKLPGGGPGHAAGNFVITRIAATIKPRESSSIPARKLRIELPGKDRILSLAEVQVFSGADNVALQGQASQSSTGFGGAAQRAIDGNTSGDYMGAMSTTHTQQSKDPWWELDLGQTHEIDRVVLWNRTDNALHTRLKDARLTLLDEQGKVVWEASAAEPPNPSAEFGVSGDRPVSFASAFADYTQSGFSPQDVLAANSDPSKGWAIGGAAGKPHTLTLIPSAPIQLPEEGSLELVIEHSSQWEKHLLGRFRLRGTADPRAAEWAGLPPDVIAILQLAPGDRSEAQRQRLLEHYLTIAPQLKPQRERLAKLQKSLADQKPYTTAPIFRELPDDQRRVTQIQHRGNWMDKGAAVEPGTPAVFPPLPEGPRDRLALARWLVSSQNPLTARVVANRVWEKMFGIGIVSTSEEFGSQGELPFHPELLDWLAVEFMESGWNFKQLAKRMALSAAYRQSSQVTPELQARDPDNRLLARGPRFRLTAEMVRDQALAVSGLLSERMYGPPVRPPQPSMGLNAAFGSSTDWEPSQGEDRWRRALYVQWRRSNPYPSMSAFDAPNREVCVLKRDRTNTPLQALVTLNDPVYVEAAQALARRIAAAPGDAAAQAGWGFRLCLARAPTPTEVERLVDLHRTVREQLSKNPAEAEKLATDPLGPLTESQDPVNLASWTVVANVLLNLDEMLMKR